ncbi:MAG TPA: hypothetical protein VE224_03545, partial [Pseudolabrys sp.]|nr:hypothetical protein [Pseudolabrys sp.]
DAIRMLGCFRLPSDHPAALLNQWLVALVRLFQPEIAALLRQRDKAVMEWRWRRRSSVYEDPRLEITSNLKIDLDSRLAAGDAASAETAPAARASRRDGGLPSMAEGWGA